MGSDENRQGSERRNLNILRLDDLQLLVHVVHVRSKHENTLPRTSGAEFRNPGRPSVALRIRVVVRPPERRDVPTEVHFAGAPNAVTDIANLRTARLRTGQGQQWKEQVVARLGTASRIDHQRWQGHNRSFAAKGQWG
jgi:hypothetical protein